MAKIITDDVKMENKSAEGISFVVAALEKDPEQRPKAEALLEHPFMRKFAELETSEELCYLISKRTTMG